MDQRLDEPGYIEVHHIKDVLCRPKRARESLHPSAYYLPMARDARYRQPKAAGGISIFPSSVEKAVMMHIS